MDGKKNVVKAAIPTRANAALRAIENQLFVVTCNAVGRFLHKDFWFDLYGHSSICGPLYGYIKGLDHDKEGLFVTNIDKKQIDIASRYFSLTTF